MKSNYILALEEVMGCHEDEHGNRDCDYGTCNYRCSEPMNATEISKYEKMLSSVKDETTDYITAAKIF